MSPRDSSSKKNKSKKASKFGRQSKPSPPEKTPESSPVSEMEQVDLQKTSAYPKKAAPGDILNLQRVLGNKSVAQALRANISSNRSQKFGKTSALQRHKTDNAPPVPEETGEVQAKPKIQRHKVDNAPPVPEEEEEVQAKPEVQRKMDGRNVQKAPAAISEFSAGQPAFGKRSGLVSGASTPNPFARQ